jgi:hypothetical protein
LLTFWSSASFAPPVPEGNLRDDEVVIANRLLNELLKQGAGGNIPAAASDGAVADQREKDPRGMVGELMNAARSEVVAALQKAKISGDLEVRSGTFSLMGSRSIDLLIYNNGNKLGDLTVRKSQQGSSGTLHATFTKAQ